MVTNRKMKRVLAAIRLPAWHRFLPLLLRSTIFCITLISRRRLYPTHFPARPSAVLSLLRPVESCTATVKPGPSIPDRGSSSPNTYRCKLGRYGSSSLQRGSYVVVAKSRGILLFRLAIIIYRSFIHLLIHHSQ